LLIRKTRRLCVPSVSGRQDFKIERRDQFFPFYIPPERCPAVFILLRLTSTVERGSRIEIPYREFINV
jgi:hypothetical protein